MVQIATGTGEGADPWWLHASTAGTGGNFRGGQPSAYSTSLAQPFTDLFTSLFTPPVNIPPLNIDIPEIMFKPADIGLAALGLNGNGTANLNNGGNGGGEKTKLLLYLLGGIVVIAAAPVLYRAANAHSRGKRAARHDKMASDLDNASERATSALGAISSAAFSSPLIAFPIAYIGLQELEDRKIIRKGVGNTIQTLMSGGAVAKMIGDIVPG